jgi:RNA polymerase sigma factor (sigma-70 family)
MSISGDLAGLIKKNDDHAIQKIYEDNRKGFILFASRYNLDREDIIDIYQDAVIVLIENVKKGKTEDLKSTLSTYLFSIGKFMIFQRAKKNGRLINQEDLEKFALEEHLPDEGEKDDRVKLLQEGFKKLGDQCRNLLSLFYYEEKKLEEIQAMLGYTTKNVLKTQKSRCLKQLKDLVKK